MYDTRTYVRTYACTDAIVDIGNFESKVETANALARLKIPFV